MAHEAKFVQQQMNPEEILSAAKALTQGEPDLIANMANLASLLWYGMEDLNWAGFYRLQEDQLVLGPFQGKPACLRIPSGKGVCGAAVTSGKTQRVPDVRQFKGHISCDPDSVSEIVVPVFRGKDLIGVLDLDSPHEDRFSAADQELLENMAALVAAS